MSSRTPQLPSLIMVSRQRSLISCTEAAMSETADLSAHPVTFITRSVSVSTSGSSMSMIRFILEMTDWFMSRQPA